MRERERNKRISSTDPNCLPDVLTKARKSRETWKADGTEAQTDRQAYRQIERQTD
jgi:hypothetical protein